MNAAPAISTASSTSGAPVAASWWASPRVKTAAAAASTSQFFACRGRSPAKQRALQLSRMVTAGAGCTGTHPPPPRRRVRPAPRRREKWPRVDAQAFRWSCRSMPWAAQSTKPYITFIMIIHMMMHCKCNATLDLSIHSTGTTQMWLIDRCS
eukprot:COSAG02_NODE_18728_length_922_cov_1.613609_1_plen_152_part_00